MRIAIPFCLLLANCVAGPGAKFVSTNPPPQPLPPKRPSDVAIVSTPPDRPFYEVGFVEGWRKGGWDDEATVLANMRVAAAQRGCDVLLVTGSNNLRAHSNMLTPMGYHGACLVRGEPAPATPAPTAPTAAVPATHAPPALLFRNDEGTLFRVQPEARNEALRAGWAQVQPEPGSMR